MAQTYIYTPQIWPPILTVILLIGLAIFAWRRRSVPGALPFMISCLFAVGWMAGVGMEYLALEGTTKFFWVKVQVSFQLPYDTAIICFFLEYTWPRRWLTRRNLILLSIPPLVVLGFILTNDLYHLIWRDFIFEGTRLPLFGPGTWFLIAYGYGLGLVNLIASAWLLIHSPQHRLPVAYMLSGVIMAYTIYLLQRIYMLQPNLLLDVLGVGFASLMYAIALFGFRIFDPIALAHQTAIEQLQAGVLVLDPQGRIVSLNPAAERIFEAFTSQIKGSLIHELLPDCSSELLAGLGGNEIEIDLKAGGETCYYTLAISPLKDWHGLEAGRLLLLQDISEQKQAQSQLLEQQRALAMLQEREQLARELHDSIGQVIGYAGFQLDAIHGLIQDGRAAISAGQATAANLMDHNLVAAKLADANRQLVAAGNQLTRMSNIIEDAHADLREYILNLRLAPSEQQPFLTSLRHYLGGFQQNYGIQVGLSVGPGVDDGRLDPSTQMQLYRIIQEALSNARKHAETNRVQVSFEQQDHLICIRIQDNGRGFDPTQTGHGEGRHFGLLFMRERAEQIGGCLHVQSAPGRGTCVIIAVPLSEDLERLTDEETKRTLAGVLRKESNDA